MSGQTVLKEVALRLSDVAKIYSGTIALQKVNITVHKGEVHGIIGKNGAGKSTLVSIVSGIINPTSGEIHVNDKIYHSLSPARAKKQHISIITQEPQVIDESTVAENLFMPHYIDGKKWINWKKVDERAKDVLYRAKFNIDVSQKARDLSISEKQLLLVIKACYVENAKIVIMDEVSASLTQKDEKILHNIIKERIANGTTILYISHRTEELLSVCDRVTVLRDGRTVETKACSELDLKTLAHLIVGDSSYETSSYVDKCAEVGGEVVFESIGLSSPGKFKDINISIRKGEIVGIAGLRGSGRTEILKSIAGIDPISSGEIRLQGKVYRFKDAPSACREKILYLPEDRDAEGLIGNATIRENITINVLPQISKNKLIKSALEQPIVENMIKILDIKAYSSEQAANQLSGGNKQKVVIGKIMANRPLLCLLDEPTRGVDIEAKESILTTIHNEMRAHASILITSPGVDDLMKVCDRILILCNGEITQVFNRCDFDEKDIFRAMQGEIIQK